MGWWIGLLVSALIMRFGLGAESFAGWGSFVCPDQCHLLSGRNITWVWLQPIALILPGAHVFEGMRTVLFEGVFDWARFWSALGLNIFYILLGIWVLMRSFEGARASGSLLQQGE